ncbi:hypothetical protein VH571_07275 [Frondihabitans sp. 4ASC-45]|uniref:hypothetical protein n=1 Tax=Frondihabitans sp. 4ASC-45 TaxID=3111636 RepID=UPI003C28D673
MSAPSQFILEPIVVDRIRELCDPSAPWFRSLWTVGTVTALLEVVESVNATWDNVLTNDGAMADFKKNAMSLVKGDLGLGSEVVREKLRLIIIKLKPESTNEGRTALAELEQFITRCRLPYLENWASAIESGQVADQQFESMCRSLASHLLDDGLHPKHLVGWIDKRRGSLNAVELIREAKLLANAQMKTYEFAVPFVKMSREVRNSLDKGHLMAVADFEALYYSCENSVKSGPLVSAPQCVLKVSFQAKDPHSALDSVREWAKRVASRAALATASLGVNLNDQVVEIGAKKIWALADQDLLRVPSILRENAVDAIDDSAQSKQLDDALAMLAPHLQSTAGVSAATLWAACEGLLGRVQSNGHSVADRLADVVACSFIREELFELVKRWRQETRGSSGPDIRHGTTFEQMTVMVDHIVSSGDPGFKRPEEQAAVARIHELATSSAPTVKRVRAYLQTAFRRLYYQRNFVMHSAKFDSVSLSMTSRIAPRLVAAGLDQIVNAHFRSGSVPPLGLAARAAIELDLVGQPGGKHIATLLS